MNRNPVLGMMLILLLIGTLTLTVRALLSPLILLSSINIEIGSATETPSSINTLAFYYPWYGTPSVSGYWRHWNDATHNPNDFWDGRRDIAAKDYPLLDVYDSKNNSLIEEHIGIAKMANIDGFVVSWWGPYSFEDVALYQIKNVAEENDFKFTIYYETTWDVTKTVNDILYILNNHANSDSWYKIDNRPVIFVYSRARDQINTHMHWYLSGNDVHWSLLEDIRDSPQPRYGIFVIEPYRDGIGYVQSDRYITLPPHETYSLKLAISDMRNDCSSYSDVGFRIKVKNVTENWRTLDDLIVNFNDGWLDLSYDISNYAGQKVLIKVESYDGGVRKWCSEWATVDYFFIVNSKGEILNENPYFDSEWKTVVNNLNEKGYNPYFIMDFGGHEGKVHDFAEYFLNFTDGIHTYNPSAFSISDISNFYNQASIAAYSKNKIFVATVMPGYDDTEIRSPGYVVDRQNGSYYNSFWSTARSTLSNHYIITSFNEWHEGTEIEPSLEYQYQYTDLTYSNTIIDTLGGLNQIINTLPDDVLSDETKNSLVSKVDNAQKSTDKDEINAAINQLNAFINEVEAQRGKKISEEAAQMLIDYAQNVITQLQV